MLFRLRLFLFSVTIVAGAALAADRPKHPPAAPEQRPASARPLDLPGAIAAALRQNPELHVYEASIAASRGGVTTARTVANPELTIAPGIKRTRDGGETTTEFHGVFELSQLLKFPGKRALEIAVARRNVELQQLALEGFRFQLSA